MTRITNILLAGATLFGLPAVAEAADLGGPLRGPSVIPAVTDPGPSGGWYLRGDVGMTFGGVKTDFKATEGDYDKSTTTDKLGSAGKIGLGIGYQFNSYLRGDITGEMFGTRTTTAEVRFVGGSTGAGTTQNLNVYNGSLTSALFLVNGYVDLGTYSGFTPYVGAGVGAVHHSLTMSEGSHWTKLTEPTNAGATLAASGNDVGTFKGHEQWNFAWALHTGFSYDLSQSLKLDVGYSYKDLGKLSQTGGSVCANSYCPGDHFEMKKIAFHDVHIGARWILDPVVKTPVYRAPVVAKF